MKSSPSSTDQPFANGGGIDVMVPSDDDPYRARRTDGPRRAAMPALAGARRVRRFRKDAVVTFRLPQL